MMAKEWFEQKGNGILGSIRREKMEAEAMAFIVSNYEGEIHPKERIITIPFDMDIGGDDWQANINFLAGRGWYVQLRTR